MNSYHNCNKKQLLISLKGNQITHEKRNQITYPKLPLYSL